MRIEGYVGLGSFKLCNVDVGTSDRDSSINCQIPNLVALILCAQFAQLVFTMRTAE
jgi:hypothetical protein